MKRLAKMARVAVVVWCGVASLCFGNAYKILNVRSTKATGMGEAFIVQADDPSAVAFNPAGLARLDGLQLSLHGTWCTSDTEHEAANGRTTDLEDEWQLVPAVYATQSLLGDRLVLGLGVSVPNGLASEWAADSFARYAATYTDLEMVDFTIALGVRVNEQLLVGAGLDFYDSEVCLERMINPLALGLPPGPDMKNELQGTGSAWGFNAGMIWEFNDRHGVALTYRHPVTIDYNDGTFRLAGFPSGSMETSIDFPGVVVAGYAFRPTDDLKIELNVDWTNWERVDSISARTPLGVETSRQDLNNTFAYKLGIEYALNERWTLRGGYIYNENATPEESWNPNQPDTDMHFFLLGCGWDWERLTIDAALQLVYYETRRIDNDVAMSTIDGTYRTLAPCLSVAATYRF